MRNLYRYAGTQFGIEYDWSSHISGILQVIKTLVSGGNTLFYFFFSLIFVTIGLELYSRLLMKARFNHYAIHIALFVLSLMFFYVGPLLPLYGRYAISTTNCMNFLPYVFAAMIIRDSLNNRGRLNVILFLSVPLAIFFILLEWKYLAYHNYVELYGPQRLLPVYGRASVVFVSLAAVNIMLRLENVSRHVAAFSAYSLGVYCVHKLVDIENMVMYFSGRTQMSLLEINIVYVSTLLVSVIIVNLMKRVSALRRFV